MEIDDIFKKRRSVRSYLDKPVPKNVIEELLNAAKLAPTSCNLQLTHFVVVDDPKIIEKLSKKVTGKFSYAPVSIIILYDKRFTVERYSVVSSAAMAAENVVLKAVDLGLSTCPMAGFNKDDIIKKELGIPGHMEILMMMSLGYQDTSVSQFSINKSKKKIFSFNKYSGDICINSAKRLEDHTTEDVIEYRKRIAPVYLDRFRLNTFSNVFYKESIDVLGRLMGDEFKKQSRVLDVMSYDGVFLKTLKESNLATKLRVVGSDYLTHNLNFFRKSLNVDTLQILPNNSFEKSNQKFDVVTFMFQIQFTPKWQKLLEEVNQLITPGGYILISLVKDTLHVKVAKLIKNLYRMVIQRKNFNIYENNPFFKIGPHKNVSKTEIKHFSSPNSFQVVKYLRFSHQKLGKISEYYLLQKCSR